METGGFPGPISLAGCQWCSLSSQVNMGRSKRRLHRVLTETRSVKDKVHYK